jgi:hypothetical protein
MHVAARQGGAIMMFVLLAGLLIAMVTLTVMRMVAGDITEGFGGLQAVQAFNIAEAGVHYAMGKLQVAGGSTYTGETLTITSGSTTLGTATITVNCVDDPGKGGPPCASSAKTDHRRIISTSTLPMSGASGGATRTVVAVVQLPGTASTYSICSYGPIFMGDDVIGTGDVGSNSGTLQVGVWNRITGNLKAGGNITLGGINGAGNTTTITGTAKANGTITATPVTGTSGPCTSGCDNTVTGGWTPSAGLSTPICPLVTVGPFSPGAGPPPVASGTIYIMSPGSYGDVTLLAGTSCGTSGVGWTDLQLQTGAVAGVTKLFQLNSITMNSCSRIVVAGAGNADLRLATAGTALGAPSSTSGLRVGAKTSDTYSSPQWVPAGQLMIEVNSSSATAVNLSSLDYFSGSLLAPNGTVNMGIKFEVAPGINGGVVAAAFNFKYNGTGIDGGVWTYDPTAQGLGSTGSTTLKLRSWKDQ